ncbi:tape measure protein [[Haemophilus] felis]|nr:tape measure protein [[Haemophilus] felis]
MSVVRELVTKLSFAYENSGLKKFVGEVKQAKTQAKADVGQIRGNLLSLKNVVMGYVAMAAGGSVMQIADEWASVSGRVKLATASAEEHKHALDEIYNIAQRTGQTFAASGDLFQKVQRNAKDLGLGTDETLKMTEIIGQTLTIGGGDTSSQQAALMQLGQALGAGKLSGDELNSIIEQSPRLAEAIANSFGVGVGQLKEMGKAGKLTAKELSQGLLKQADKIQKEFDEMPKTFSFGMTVMKNAMGRWISYAVNDVLNLGQRFYQLSKWIEKNIKLVLILAVSAIGGKLMLALKGVQSSLRAITVQAIKAFAPFLAITALLVGIGLILEDLYVWVNGGDSLADDLFGDFKDWEGQFKDIGDLFRSLWFNIKLLAKELFALTGIDFNIDWKSWQDFAKSALQYVIDGVKSFVKVLRSAVSIVRAIMRGDFSYAFGLAKNAVDDLSWKFLPFYSIALMVLGGIGSAILWLVKSPFRYLGKAIYVVVFALTKLVTFTWALAKPFWTLIKVVTLFSKIAIQAIWAIARAMLLAMATNPILLAIALIIAALVAIVVYWDEIKAVAGEVWDWISTKASEIWADIEKSCGEMWDNVKKQAESMWNGITDPIKKVWAGITDFFKKGWDSAISAVTDMFSSLIPNWVKNLFSDGSSVTVNGTAEQPLVSTASAQQAGNRSVQVQQTQNNTYNVHSTNPKQAANEISRHQKNVGFDIYNPEYGYGW